MLWSKNSKRTRCSRPLPLTNPSPKKVNPTARNDLSSLEDLTREPERPDPGDIFDVDWENYLESYGGDYSPAQKDFADRPPMENMVTYQETLFQYLLRQLQLSHIEGEDRRIALEIIGNVDENGYLDVELAGIGRFSASSGGRR